MKNEKPIWCHLLFYFTSYVLNMFQTLIYPSLGACDCVDELQHLSSCSQFVVCWRFGAAENKTTDVVIQKHSLKLLMMDILMYETCWAHKKWNKIASDTNLVFHSSTIKMMHGPTNIRFVYCVFLFLCLCILIVMYILSHPFGSIVCSCIYGCKFCMLLFNFVCYISLFLCLCILVFMYIQF